LLNSPGSLFKHLHITVAKCSHHSYDMMVRLELVLVV